MGKNKKKFTLTSRWFTFIVCTLLLSANIGLGILIMDQSKETMTQQMHTRMIDIAEVAAASIDGDVFASITKEDYDAQSENFRDCFRKLDIYQKISEVKYIYAVRHVDGNNTEFDVQPDPEEDFVFIVDPDPVEPAGYGEEIVYTEALCAAAQGQPSVDQEASEDRWGSFYSAYCPIYDTNNVIVGIIGVDYSAIWYDSQVSRNNSFYMILSVVSLLIGGAIVLLITLKLRRRLSGLYKDVSSLAVDLEGLTKEIIEGDAQADEEEGAMSSSAGETIEALGLKIGSMQEKLKKYIFHVRTQAYTDIMTGFGNKTAYLEDVGAINKKIEEGNAVFSVAMFDINGLKYINDNCGHEVGDLIIDDAAALIKKVFDRKQVYRIGGDEFLAVLENIDKAALKEKIAKLDEMVAEFNKTAKSYPTELSFSRGYSTFDPSTDTEFRQVFKRVDEAMYRNKAKYYSQGNRRRYRDESEQPE